MYHALVENYVHNIINLQMSSENIDYIPFEKALVLEGLEDDAELRKEVEQLEKTVKSLALRFDTFEV